MGKNVFVPFASGCPAGSQRHLERGLFPRCSPLGITVVEFKVDPQKDRRCFMSGRWEGRNVETFSRKNNSSRILAEGTDVAVANGDIPNSIL